MAIPLTEGERLLLASLEKQFPDVEAEAIEAIGAAVISFLADHIEQGWTPALVKLNQRGIPQKIHVLELKPPKNDTLSPIEDFLNFAPAHPTKR